MKKDCNNSLNIFSIHTVMYTTYIIYKYIFNFTAILLF